MTMVVSLHQVEYARRYAERIIGLNEGLVVFDGPPNALSDDILETIYGRHNGRTSLAHS
jgi:phosphonate transport system ATP-binding protein